MTIFLFSQVPVHMTNPDYDMRYVFGLTVASNGQRQSLIAARLPWKDVSFP